MKDYCFSTKNVSSISRICQDAELKQTIQQNDFIRNETLRILCSIPSYPYKTLEWKNRYYDVIRKHVAARLV